MYIPKKVLIVVGGLVSVSLVGFGSWAIFTAQNKNPTNTFSNGTLVLSVKKGSGSACLSTGGGSTDSNSNSSCDTVFTESVKKPGDSAVSELLTVKNEGSLAASVLKLFTTSCASADNSESYHGSGDACAKVQIYIQQFSDSGGTTASACLYGGASGNTCDFSDATKTVAAFATAYPDAANGLAIGSGLASGASAYFKVGIKLPSNADNTFQGRKATWDLNWYLEQ